MADISDQEISELVKAGQLDVETAMKYFPDAAAKAIYKEVATAIEQGDEGKLQQLRANPSYNSADTNRLIQAVQGQKEILRVVESVQVMRQAEQKKARGEKISLEEQFHLEQKNTIEKTFTDLVAKRDKNEKAEALETTQNLSALKWKGEDQHAQDVKSLKQEVDKAKPFDYNKAYETSGDIGYLPGNIKLEDYEKRDTEWRGVFEKGLDQFNKAFNGKDPADIVMNLMVASMMAPLEMMNEWLKEVHKNQKEDIKTLKKKRSDLISDQLKANGTTMHQLAAKLSRDTQHWLLNDKNYANLPDVPKTKYEKLIAAKRDFAASLPKKEDGNIDFSKMSKRQTKKYAAYMGHLANSPKWKNYVYNMTGLGIFHKEILEKAKKIQSIHLEENLLKQQQAVRQAPQSQAEPKAATATPKVTKQVSRPTRETPTPGATAKPTAAINPRTAPQPTRAAFKPAPAPQATPTPTPVTKEAPAARPAAAMPTPAATTGLETPTPAAADRPTPAATTELETPAPAAADKPTPAATTGLETPAPAAAAPKESGSVKTEMPTPKPSVEHAPTPEGAPKANLTVPKTILTDETTKLREEALTSVTLEPLDNVNISGSLKKPVMNLPDGTTVAITDENKDILTSKAKKLENDKKANDEAASKNRQQQHELAQSRSNDGQGQSKQQIRKNDGKSMG